MSEHFTPTFKETVVAFAAVESVKIDEDPTSESFGHMIATYKTGATQDYGIVTAYAAAVNAGYTGTEAQFATDLANVFTLATGKKYVDGVITDLAEGDFGYQNNAQYYAEEAMNAKNSSDTNALKAEGFATGKQNGVNSEEYETTNASYYAGVAYNHSAASSDTRYISEGYATGTRNNAAITDTSSLFYHNNAKYFANSAAESNKAAERYAKGTENGQAVANGTGFQDNAKYYSEQAASSASTASNAASAATTAKNQANSAYNSLVNMTIGVTTGEADTEATVVKTHNTGSDHLQFTIPRGTPFTIYRNYATIAAMEADLANVAEGKFVMITAAGGAEDPDNAKLYFRGSNGFTFVTDLSGATGLQGPIATATSSTVYQCSTSGTTVPTGTWSNSPNPTLGQYLWCKTELTWNDTNHTVTTLYSVAYSPATSSVTTVDGVAPDGTGDIALSGTYAPISSPVFTDAVTLGSRLSSSTVGANSAAFGYNCTASGQGSFAQGNSKATARYAHAEGSSEANGINSHSSGTDTKANLYAEMVTGRLNVADETYPEWVAGTEYSVGVKVSQNGSGFICTTANSDTTFNNNHWHGLPSNGKNLFVIGNGYPGVGGTNITRSNAFTVDADGNGEFQGDVIANGNGGSNPISLTDIANLLKTQDVSSEVSFSSTDGTISNAYVYRSGNMVHMAFVFTFTQAVNANTYVTIPITYTNNALGPIARTEGGGANNENIALIDILPSPNRITFYTLQNRSVDQNFWLTITYMCAG